MIEELVERRVGLIGCGAMARALAGGLLKAGLSADRIRASDPDPDQRAGFETQLGLKPSANNGEVVAASDIVVLAVKPAVIPLVLRDLGGDADLARPLWISIAAGVPLAALAGALPEGSRILRAMPNTPALVGAGATALCANPAADERDRAAGQALFRAVGSVWQAPEEPLLDAVTGLSGSGPAYVFRFLEALAEAGVRAGLPGEVASELALQTVYGAVVLARESGKTPAQLREQVTSPGGTTSAGLERLEAGGLASALVEAVAAATARSRELGRR